MRIKSYVFLCFLVLTFLSGCSPENQEEIKEITPDTIITMEILDDYMFRDDVQYVDLRNHDQLFRSGFIYSFENIPFFDYLDYNAFVRNGTYEFNPDQLINEEQLTRFFDPDKAIFLTADGCIRSGYVKDALNYLGYERVYVIGGYFEYTGEYNVLGDGSYNVGSSFYGFSTDDSTNLTYHIYGAYDIDRHPLIVHINVIDIEGNSIRNEGYDNVIDYNHQFTLLENAFQRVANFNDLYEYISDPNDNNFKDIEGYDLGFPEGLINAIKQLTTNQ